MQSQSISPSNGSPILRGIGISLLFVAVVYLVTGVILRPIMPPFVHSVLDGIYNGLLCGPGEHYQQDPLLRGAMRRNIVGEGDSWCENANGEMRDISFSEFNVAIALFVIPLILGSVFVARSTPNLSRSSPKSSVFRSNAGADLSSRLQELQTAYDKGLISQEEYNQTRANLLKQLEK
jgi:hypothetical protein